MSGQTVVLQKGFAYVHRRGELLPLDRIWPVTSSAPDKVRWFAALMQAGAEFPPIRVRIWADAKFIVIDGVNRFGGSVLAGFSHIPTVVEGT